MTLPLIQTQAVNVAIAAGSVIITATIAVPASTTPAAVQVRCVSKYASKVAAFVWSCM